LVSYIDGLTYKFLSGIFIIDLVVLDEFSFLTLKSFKLKNIIKQLIIYLIGKINLLLYDLYNKVPDPLINRNRRNKVSKD
jgi:hypothetical protein